MHFSGQLSPATVSTRAISFECVAIEEKRRRKMKRKKEEKKEEQKTHPLESVKNAYGVPCSFLVDDVFAVP